MSTTQTDPNAAVKAQAGQIVNDGTDIRPRLADFVARNASGSQQSGGLVALIRAVVEGAREGLDRSLPQDRDAALRQVVDALGDGLSQAALAGQLALQEAAGTSRQFADKDLTCLHDDLAAVRDLFAETVERGLKTCKALTAGEVAAARRHAGRVEERLRPAVTRALDAVREHPAAFAREGFKAGVSTGRGAAGSLFQALGHMLQQAGEQMRRDGGPGGTQSGDRGAAEATNKTKGKT